MILKNKFYQLFCILKTTNICYNSKKKKIKNKYMISVRK